MSVLQITGVCSWEGDMVLLEVVEKCFNWGTGDVRRMFGAVHLSKLYWLILFMIFWYFIVLLD